MAPLVRGHDRYTGLEMVIEGNYDNDPGGGYKRIPLLGEEFRITRATFPKSREIGNVGAQSTADFGRGSIEASFTVYPRYQAVWFNQLLVHAFGGSEVLGAVDKLLDGTSTGGAVGTFRVHNFLPQSYKMSAAGSASGVGPGLTFRAWRGGNTTGGTREIFTGCIIKRMRWEHPAGDRPRVTFDIIGQIATVPYATIAGDLVAPILTDTPIRARDLKNRTGLAKSPGILKVGAAGTRDLNVTAFEFQLESNVEFAPSFLNDPDGLQKPGHVDGWRVSGKISCLVEQHLLATDTGTPILDYLEKRASALRIRYVSDTNAHATDPVPYACDIYIKNLIWSKMDDGVTEGGAPPLTFEFEGQLATYTTGESSLAANSKNMLLIQTVGQNSAYASSAEGGNLVIGDDDGYAGPTPPTTNDADLDWIAVAEALVDAGAYAHTIVADATTKYAGFDLAAIPSGAAILGIEVALDLYKEESTGSGTLTIEVDLSWDGGTSWTTAKTTGELTTTEATYALGATSDTWGHVWDTAGGEMGPTMFKVRVKSKVTGGTGTPEWRLDYVSVIAAYSTAV